MNILGLHTGHDATAAVIVDDRLVSMVEKERLNRIKYDRAFSPEMVIKALELAGIEYKDLDCVVLSQSDLTDINFRGQKSDQWGMTVRKDGKPYLNGPRSIDPWDCEDGFTVNFDGVEKPGYQVQHHVAHAASSYYVSDFDEATAITYDGSGLPENQTSLTCKCKGNKIEVIGIPNMVGAMAYSLTSKIMYGSWMSSGKLMGLAAYGEPYFYYKSLLNDISIDGLVKNLWDILYPDKGQTWDKDFIQVKGWRSGNVTKVAASVQKYFEENMKLIMRLMEKWKLHDNLKNIIISGGGALNVITNRWLCDRYNIFTAPFVKDDGLAPGGALYVLHHIFDRPRQNYTTSEITFLGGGSDRGFSPSFSPASLKATANYLSKDEVVLWHQGRSEVGPRALTHRSIFASPFTDEMKRRVSIDIKGREEYRPLAPIVKAEDCDKYFDISPSPMSELMLVNAKVKSDKLKAITHVDGTARVQTVSKEFNPEVHELLCEFEKLTGYPVLINTSLNIQGQSICETEFDTRWTFENCDADVCVIDGEVTQK